MKYFFLLIFSLAIQSAALHAADEDTFSLKRDVAQYKGSDYKNVLRIARGISLEEAFDIAKSDPNIDYFVYTKGIMMVLEIPSNVEYDEMDDPFGLASQENFRFDSGELSSGYCRIFRQGDVVFFKKEGIWLGSAKGLADTYFKNDNPLD